VQITHKFDNFYTIVEISVRILEHGTVYTWVHKVCDAAGLPHRTVHSLRHTNITMQIAAGVPLVTVAGRAGYARTSTTTDIYSHFLKSSDRTAAEKLEQLFE
jgi:integrase